MSGPLRVWSVVSRETLDSVWCAAGVEGGLTQDLRLCLVDKRRPKVESLALRVWTSGSRTMLDSVYDAACSRK